MADWRSRAGCTFDTDKQPAYGAQGMVVTNNPLGSAAGAEMLAAGGNAIDAAVAALFALTVVEPMMVGVFGAGMTTIRRADGSRHFINNYARAPQAATADMYRPLANDWPDYQKVEGNLNDVGVLAVGVPGTLMGWCELLRQHGTLSLADVLGPAIRHARHGFPVTRYLHEILAKDQPEIARFPATAATWLRDGQPLAPGARAKQPAYADALELIARDGPSALYDGQLGQLAVDYIAREGGLITMEDLRSYEIAQPPPVTGSYRGYEIIGPAPPSAGGVHIVEMLNLLEHFDIAAMGFGSPASMHLLIEILKVGFEDRRQYMGDPDFVDVPIERLTSKSHAAEWRSRISLDSVRGVNTAWSPESANTTHLTTADADGNVVAATHTIHSTFGCKATVPETGMVLNNTMNIFDPHPGLANSIAPGKRMTSSMSPVIVERDGRPAFALGSVGGVRIFPSVFQAIVNVIDHGMSAQEAVEAPRLWTLGDVVEVEPGPSGAALRALRHLGHRVDELKIVGAGMGMIRFHEAGLEGASCWRADGTPMALGGGMARPGLRFSV